MNQRNRSLRVGISAIACALVFRLCSGELPGKLLELLTREETAAFLTYMETGRDVRFSPSLEAFAPDFMESPPAATTAPTEPPLPSFSDPEAVELYYGVSVDPDVESLLSQPLQWSLRGELPTVLILHTHSTESYTKSGEDYQETSPWRTLDEGYNMLSIGELVAERLNSAGIPTVQIRQLHDYPSYNGSYVRARKTMKEALEEYPSVQLVLDLHRDASGGDSGQLRTVAQLDNQTIAQLMLVLGANQENYDRNLSLALKLHAQLESQFPGIMRPLQLRAARFNQDLSPGALLVEVGAAGNTHGEARAAAEQLAQAVIALAEGTA